MDALSSCHEIELVPYHPVLKSQWDAYVQKAKNSHFFFLRDYMDYHADRFVDASMLFYKNGKLAGLLPANRSGDVLYSHQGLTYGGMLADERMSASLMLSLFTKLVYHMKQEGIRKLVYKAIPYIFYAMPAEEDRYALTVHHARLVRRELSSVIWLPGGARYSKGRKWTINKARKNALEIGQSENYREFMALLSEALIKHEVRPAHSSEEIAMLAQRFPQNIKLYAATNGDQMLAGALVFENARVVHTQYLANSEAGREIGALDLLLDHLIQNVYASKDYFSFGISTEDRGKVLNVGLTEQKEGFGARTVVHDIYELDITDVH